VHLHILLYNCGVLEFFKNFRHTKKNRAFLGYIQTHVVGFGPTSDLNFIVLPGKRYFIVTFHYSRDKIKKKKKKKPRYPEIEWSANVPQNGIFSGDMKKAIHYSEILVIHKLSDNKKIIQLHVLSPEGGLKCLQTNIPTNTDR